MLELETIITNGYVDISTMAHFIDRGFIFVTTVPAKLCHPHACDTDKLSIFSKYTEPQISGDIACNKQVI